VHLRLRRALPLLAALAALCLTAPAYASDAPVPKLDWQRCDDGFECATAQVPLDHDRPRGRSIELALIRDPADDPERRIGSLFINPGGPGISGVDFLREAPPIARQIVGRRFDLVGFDTRGAGASRPSLDCQTDQESRGLYAQPFTRPDSDLGEHVRRAAAYVKRCVERNGDLMAHVGTADVARDLDLLRAAVGDKRLNYIGISYGTLIGATYTSLFPGRARALVLDAPIDAGTWGKRPFETFREQSSSFENVLDRFFSSCVAHRNACGFGGDDPEAAFDALVERLDARPLAVAGRTLDGDDVRAAAFQAIYTAARWPQLAAGLREAEAGGGSILRAFADNFYDRRPDGSQGTLWDVYFAVTALDQDYPTRVAPFLEAGRHAFSLFDNFWFNSGYYELPQGLSPYESRDVYRGPFRHPSSAPPALVIGGTHDPATPYRWAKRLAADLGNARLLTARGNGHGATTTLAPCIVAPVLAYLEQGTLPPEGAACTLPDPFAAAGRAASWVRPPTRPRRSDDVRAAGDRGQRRRAVGQHTLEDRGQLRATASDDARAPRSTSDRWESQPLALTAWRRAVALRRGNRDRSR
jgi:pimeloyl-ACP methyl ester carboxylesterase